MDKKEFKEVVGNVLKKNGFKYGKKHFYLEDDKLLVYIDFQKSNFSNSYYIEYCFIIKDLHPQIEKFHLKDVDFRARFAYYDENDAIKADFELDLLTLQQVELSIEREINNEIIPAFELGILSYLRERPIMKKMSSIRTKEFLLSLE